MFLIGLCSKAETLLILLVGLCVLRCVLLGRSAFNESSDSSMSEDAEEWGILGPVAVARRTKQNGVSSILGSNGTDAGQDSIIDRLADLLRRQKLPGARHDEKIVKNKYCRRGDTTFQSFNGTLFLHVGKAGGGTIQTRLGVRHLRVCIDECHPVPCQIPLLERRYDNVIISLRDPVDRFVSAFNWRAFKSCKPFNESRTNDRKRAERDPTRFCKNRHPSEAIIIHSKHDSDPNSLAKHLCDPLLAPAAAVDMEEIQHLNGLVSGWLPRHVDWYINGKVIATILEPGFDLVPQIDSIVQWLVNTSTDPVPPLSYWTEDFLRRTANNSANHNPIPVQAHHSVKQWGIKTPKLTPYSSCCVARYYRQDYELLALLANFVCQGNKASQCRDAIASILARRKVFLQDMTRSCDQLTSSLKV